MRNFFLLLTLAMLSLSLPSCAESIPPLPEGPPGPAEDWPTRLHDVYRSGVTGEDISLPLKPTWRFTTKGRPAPAWTESPAQHDYLHKWYDLKPRQHFDRCFDVAVVGDQVFFGSSSSGVITCLNAKDGAEEWLYFTDGPVRFAPHVAGGKVYAGSDDGFVYCLNSADGTLVWKERCGPSEDLLWGNQQLISAWPVRTSVLVHGDEVFWTCGIFPEEGMFLCKRKAADGSGGWVKPASAPHQGYSLAVGDQFIAPSGKTYPRAYSVETGKFLGDIMGGSRDGGCWALVSPDTKELWFGPTTENKVQAYDRKAKKVIASVPNANNLIVHGDYAFFNTDTAVAMLKREGGKVLWTKECVYPYAMIKAGRLLFVGGDQAVAALDLNGNEQWRAEVDGKAYGLAMAHGRLYVSTDKGTIEVFEQAG